MCPIWLGLCSSILTLSSTDLEGVFSCLGFVFTNTSTTHHFLTVFLLLHGLDGIPGILASSNAWVFSHNSLFVTCLRTLLDKCIFLDNNQNFNLLVYLCLIRSCLLYITCSRRATCVFFFFLTKGMLYIDEHRWVKTVLSNTDAAHSMMLHGRRHHKHGCR